MKQLHQMFDVDEVRKAIIDRWTTLEFVEYLEITIEELVDAFEDRWLSREEVLEELGFTELTDDDSYEP